VLLCYLRYLSFFLVKFVRKHEFVLTLLPMANKDAYKMIATKMVSVTFLGRGVFDHCMLRTFKI